jgi:hypothetical protein
MKSRNRAESKRHNDFPNQSDIDELLGFLPKLRSLKGKYTIKGAGIEKKSGGYFSIVSPQYVPVVIEFFSIASKRCWSDYHYDPEAAAKMFEDPTLINNATLDQIRTLLTWCVRGERFCDGHWAAVLSAGRIFSLLDRLRNIRNRDFKERASIRTEVLPFSYRIQKRFPRMRNIESFEGGAMFAAEKDGKFYIILDERTMSGFLADEDDDLRDGLLKVFEFEDEDDRERYLRLRKRKQTERKLKEGNILSIKSLVVPTEKQAPPKQSGRGRRATAGKDSADDPNQGELFAARKPKKKAAKRR